MSDDQVVGLCGLFFMAAVAVYLRFRKNASEEDKTLSATLTLALIASPFIFLLYYLVSKL